MAHPSARLTVFSRQLLVKRVLIDGWPVATVAEQLGISRATGYKWVRRYRADGLPGLEDRSSRPHRSPRRSSDAVTADDHLGACPAALWPGPPGAAHRPSALDHLRRPAPGRPEPPARHRPGDRCPGPLRGLPPGALVHQDHKKLGRVPDGGGWRVLGRGRVAGITAASSRLRPSRGVRRRRQPLCRRRAGRRRTRRERLVGGRAGHRPVRRGRDPHRADTHRQRRELSQPRLSRHARAATTSATSAPGHSDPQTNGKAERFIQTLLNEWAYARPYRSNGDRLQALPRFVDFYNHGRPHTAIGGLVPRVAVNNVPEHHT